MISIIIPVYQCGNKLSKIIEDILKQTFRDYEVLLIDDGSDDNTGEVCQKYEKKDSRIRAVLNKHQGVSATRNTGISLAKGEYIAFIDSDDRIESDYLEELYKNIKGYDLIISTFDRWFFQKKNRVKVVKNIQINAKIPMNKNFAEYFSRLYVSTLLGTPCCKLFCTDVIRENQIRFRTDISIGEDYIFNFDYLKNCRNIRCIPYMGYHYVCKSGNSLTHQKDLRKHEYGKILYSESIRFSNEMGLSGEASKGIHNLYLRTIFKNIELAYQIEPQMSKKEIRSYIQRIIEDEDTRLALENAQPDTKEFWIYKMILNTKIPFVIGNFAKLRLHFKKMIGRT